MVAIVLSSVPSFGCAGHARVLLQGRRPPVDVLAPVRIPPLHGAGQPDATAHRGVPGGQGSPDTLACPSFGMVRSVAVVPLLVEPRLCAGVRHHQTANNHKSQHRHILHAQKKCAHNCVPVCQFYARTHPRVQCIHQKAILPIYWLVGHLKRAELLQHNAPTDPVSCVEGCFTLKPDVG